MILLGRGMQGSRVTSVKGRAWAWAFCPRRDLLGAVLFGRSGTADDWVRVAFGEPISLAGGAWGRFGRSAGLDRGVVAQV